MKKLSLIALAVIAAMSSFAAPEKTPTKADLADYYEAGQLCVCVYFEEEVCNPIVFAGTYNNWATGDVEEMAHFEEVTGFEGWYVVAVTDESEDIQGKPVQLKSDGTFSWDYQTGDVNSWTLVSGAVTIEAGYDGESDLRNYSTDEPVILISHYFKKHQSPCVAEIRHLYTVTLDAPLCADAEENYFAPAIIGSFNDWGSAGGGTNEGIAMVLDEETFLYSYSFTDKEGGQFKFKALGDTDWSNQIQILVTNEETGESEWIDNPNIVLGADTVITLDYSEGRYTLCTEFAAPDKTPTKADLADYYESGQLCVCVYFEEEVCNPIVFAGTYNNWATDDVEAMAHFEEVTGFEGWYVVAVTDESENIQGKPVQLKSDGTFSWDYQTGDVDSWTLVSGTVSILAGFSWESDLRNYSTDEPVILISHYFKKHNNPCNEVRHDYTVNLKAPVCADAEGNYFTPAIIGSFNNWAEGVAMIFNEETQVYSYTFNDRAGGEFKFRASGDTDWSNQIQILVTNEETGEPRWWYNPNIVLGTDTVITLDYSEGRYTLCTESTPTVIDHTSANDITNPRKVLINRQVYILRNSKTYTTTGIEIK